MKTLIFTDAGNKIGYGHLTRCQVLHNELTARNIPTKFFVHSIEPIENHIDFAFEYFNWDTIDFKRIIDAEDLCIVDSYIVKPEQESQIAGLAAKVLFIDDFGNYDHPGLVLNYSLNLKESVNNNPRLLLGPKYTLLKEPFASYDSNFLIKNSVQQVLITLGGSNYSNIAYDILDVLAPKYPNILFKAIVSNKIKRYHYKNIELLDFCLPNELLKHMINSDLLIITPSQTLYEVMKLRIPSISIITSDNQALNIPTNYPTIDVTQNKTLQEKRLNYIFKKTLKYNIRNSIVNDYVNIDNNAIFVINSFLEWIYNDK